MPRPLSAAIQDHLVPWRDLPWPLPWGALFGRAAPLALEIGFGNGAFLVEEAARHPERDHVGVELSWTAAMHLFRRLDRSGLANVRVLLADAELTLERLIAPGSLEAVFVNHPCPWPKARHAARRLVRPDFLALAASRMRPGASFLLVTDHDAYAREAAEALEGQPELESLHPTTEVARIPHREPTKYERKALDRGESIHYFEWRRRRGGPSSSPAPDAPPPPEADPMPTLLFRGPRDEEALFDGLERTPWQASREGVSILVRLGPAYREIGRPVWVVEALVREDRLQQEFLLQVVRLDGDELLVKLGDPGRPHVTEGVKAAVWRLGVWLREHHPGLTLVRDTVGASARGG